MVSYSTNLETWGSTGTKPPSDYKFQDDVPPVDVFDNWFHYNVIEDIKSLIDTTNSRIESAKGLSGGEPASPETSHLYHDQDAERLKLWDSTDSSWRQLLFRNGDTLTGALSFGGYNADNVGNITNDNGVTIWDNTNEEIPYTNLSNTTVTVAGNNVSIGGSTSVSHGDLIDVTASAHHAKYTDQEAVDAVNAENSLSVDISGDADTLDGKEYSDIQTWVNNNADVSNADHADTAGDAETVDGYNIQKDGVDGPGIINFKTQ